MLSCNILGLTVCILLAMALGVSSHGNMKYPYSWYDTNKQGLNKYKVGSTEVDIPPTDEPPIWPNMRGRKLWQDAWYENVTSIPGEPTLSGAMLGNRPPNKNPWHAPGTAPISSPCGRFGGNPHGCRGGPPIEKYGDCCRAKHESCNVGFAYGYNAETRPPKDAPTTLWELGSIQEVVWDMLANHEGGYSFRLCKIPDDYIPGESLEGILTEDCFRNTTLDFFGDTVRKNNQEVPALRTKEGTSPPGSHWTRNPFRKGTSGRVRDMIQVPANLEPGKYVLSFRWDCQLTPQIWNICANIDII